MKAAITGDIIGYTSLDKGGKIQLEKALLQLFAILKDRNKAYCRLVKGDNIECFLDEPGNAMTVAICLKSFLKSISADLSGHALDEKRFKLFKTYGIRLAVGIGGMERFEPESMNFDGEAIYLSGRLISGNTTYNKKRPGVKNTLLFTSMNDDWNENFGAIFALTEELLNKGTSRQNEVLYNRILGLTEGEVADEMKISQPVVNSQSGALGWGAIERATQYFKKTFSHV